MSILGRWLGTDRDVEYREAIDLYNGGRYAEAIAAFEVFLSGRVIPGDPRGALARFYVAEAHSELGWVALERGERERARDEFVAARAAGYRYPDLHLRLGRLQEDLGENAAAEAAYDTALEIHPSFQEALAHRASLRLRAGRPAGQDLTRLAELGWSLPSGWEALDRPGAQAALGPSGLSPSLASLATEVIAALGDELFAREQVADEVGAALEAFESEDGATALARLEAAVLLRPDYPDLHFRIGVLLARAGQRERAEEAFQRALQLNPEYLEARRWLHRMRDGRAA